MTKDNLASLRIKELIDLKDLRVFVSQREFVSIYRIISDVLKAPLPLKAIDLLQTTTHSTQQISAELGYGDLSNFYRAFKRWTGRNPGFYRKESTAFSKTVTASPDFS
ncbi:MAG: helix-turn-helix domain-containing protein [Smithella sp.]